MEIRGVRSDSIVPLDVGGGDEDAPKVPERLVESSTLKRDDRIELSSGAFDRLGRIRGLVEAGAYNDVAVAAAVAQRLIDTGIV